jgi:hypothetical protein
MSVRSAKNELRNVRAAVGLPANTPPRRGQPKDEIKPAGISGARRALGLRGEQLEAAVRRSGG